MILVCSFFWHIHMALVSPHNFRTQFLLLNLKLCRSDTKIQGPINPKLQLQQPTCTLLQLWWNFRTTEMSKTTASWVLQTELYPGLDAPYSRFSCEFSSEVVVRVALRNKNRALTPNPKYKHGSKEKEWSVFKFWNPPEKRRERRPASVSCRRIAGANSRTLHFI